MKKTTIFLILVTLISCNCLPQIPIQTIYADVNCESRLPNYLEYFEVIDNCEGARLTQSPPPGYQLDAGSPYVNVTIEAVDISGNIDQRKFDVIMLDTLPPELRVDSTFFTYTWEQSKDILTAYQHNIENHMRRADQVYYDSIKHTHNLVTMVSLQHKSVSSYWPNNEIWYPVDSLARAKLGIDIYTYNITVE